MNSLQTDTTTFRFCRRLPDVHRPRLVCSALQPSMENRVKVLDFDVRAWRAPTITENLAVARLGIDHGQR